MFRIRIRGVVVGAAIVLLVLTGGMLRQQGLLAVEKTYTLDAHFDEGVLTGVEHQTVHDQLQLSRQQTTLPFIWVPNNEGTVSKVDTITGNELGRYRVAPRGDCSPSRTTVDLDGSCWVGNRQAGTVVKIGLLEAGQWIDRNGNGVCDTSRDTNGNGNIDPGEILPWGQDECVLFEVVLINGKQGTYVPGTYPGLYDLDYWGTAPRGLAVDRDNNVWAGTWSSQKFYYIRGSDGAILKTVNFSAYSPGYGSYGAVIDGDGVLWSASQGGNVLVRIDPETDPVQISTVWIGHFVYGIALDQLGHLFVNGWNNWCISRVNLATSTKEWTKSGPPDGRGITCTSDNDVWAVSSNNGWVYRYNNDGAIKAYVYVGGELTGAAVDAAGKVWACANNTNPIARINPATNAVDLTKTIVNSGGHYTYSDMTGIIARNVTQPTGTWVVAYDSGALDTPWGTIDWTSAEPGDSDITVTARSSNDGTTYSVAQPVTNGVYFSTVPKGRYLKVAVTFRASSTDDDGDGFRDSPILYDVTVAGGYEPSDLMARAKPGRVDLVWTPIPGYSYKVYRSATNGGPYAYLGTPTGYVYVDWNVVTGSTYYYVLRPVAGGVEKGQSNQAWATVPVRRR